MPIENGNYEQRTVEELQSAIEQQLKADFGEDIDLTDSSVFTTLAEVVATVLANNQEESLEEVYQSAFLETATGQALDRVVALLGLTRRPAIHATGVELFEATGRVEQDYVIQKGTTVQTEGAQPVEFETAEQVSLSLYDDFESGNLSDYSGDTADFTIVASNAYNGSQALEAAAVSGSHIYDDSININQGTRLHGHVRPTAGTVPILTFFIDPNDPDDYLQVAVDDNLGEVRLEHVENNTVQTVIDSVSYNFTAGNYYEVVIEPRITNSIGVTVNDASGNELVTLGGSNSAEQSGHVGLKSGDANGKKHFDWYTESAVTADIRAVNGGSVGNVGPNSITDQPSPTSGVDTVTNPYPTGEQSYEDTSGRAFRFGQDEETDDELRERAREAVSGGGDATHDAIVSELINKTDGVTSVTLYENKTDTDNTGTGGLPPHSFEPVVYGGDDLNVAETIFSKKAVTANSYGGAHGTAVTKTVTAESNGQQFSIDFSRPTEVSIDITLDLAIDGTYVGDDVIRDEIVQYIGGTLSDGSTTLGLGVGENVIIDALRDIIVGDDTGVVGFDQSVDGSPITTTPAITTVNGLRVVDIGASEVAQSDASDASITINTRQV